jgi:hypothetical protein
MLARCGPTHRLEQSLHLDGCHPRPVHAHIRGLPPSWEFATILRRLHVLPELPLPPAAATGLTRRMNALTHRPQ